MHKAALQLLPRVFISVLRASILLILFTYQISHGIHSHTLPTMASQPAKQTLLVTIEHMWPPLPVSKNKRNISIIKDGMKERANNKLKKPIKMT